MFKKMYSAGEAVQNKMRMGEKGENERVRMRARAKEREEGE